eukprot:jgi/Bigna1/127163/aug1.4_g1871
MRVFSNTPNPPPPSQKSSYNVDNNAATTSGHESDMQAHLDDINPIPPLPAAFASGDEKSPPLKAPWAEADDRRRRLMMMAKAAMEDDDDDVVLDKRHDAASQPPPPFLAVMACLKMA